MSERLDISVVFPAYNEETTIAEAIREAEDALQSSGYRYELLVLDDGSSDSTWGILTSLTETIPTLRLLRHEHNQGITCSLDHLFEAARGKWLFPNGSDGQWKTADVLRMIPLTKDHDVVVGRRKDKHYALARRLVSTLFNFLPWVLFGVRTYDAGSIKLFPRKLIAECSLLSRSPFREAERLIRASYRGYRIAVITVDSYPRRAGRGSGAKPSLVWHSFRDCLRCWWRIVVCRDR